MRSKNTTLDIIFIVIFSILVFFGALFIFLEIKDPSNQKKVSVRSLERVMNKKVNKRIRSLEGKKVFFKNKIRNGTDVEYMENEGAVSAESQKDNSFQIFKKDEDFNKDQGAKSVFDGVLEEANIEAQSYPSNELEFYKKELIERARDAGWYIELNDDLEVIKQEKIN